MKKVWKKLTVLLLGVVMLLAALPVQAANFCHVTLDGNKITAVYYPGKNSGYNEIAIGQIVERSKSSSLKNLKSSNKSVLTVKATKYKNGNMYSTEIMAYAKKAGSATVSFKAGGKSYKVKVTVKGYANPVSYIKVGGTKLSATKFKKTNVASLKYAKFANKNCKITVKPAKGWKLSGKIQFLSDYYESDGYKVPTQTLVVNKKNVVIKGRKPSKSFSPCLQLVLVNSKTGISEIVRIDFK